MLHIKLMFLAAVISTSSAALLTQMVSGNWRDNGYDVLIRQNQGSKQFLVFHTDPQWNQVIGKITGDSQISVAFPGYNNTKIGNLIMNGFYIVCFWSDGTTWQQYKYLPVKPAENLQTYLDGRWEDAYGNISITRGPYDYNYFTCVFINSTRPNATGYQWYNNEQITVTFKDDKTYDAFVVDDHIWYSIKEFWTKVLPSKQYSLSHEIELEFKAKSLNPEQEE